MSFQQERTLTGEVVLYPVDRPLYGIRRRTCGHAGKKEKIVYRNSIFISGLAAGIKPCSEAFIIYFSSPLSLSASATPSIISVHRISSFGMIYILEQPSKI